MYRNKSLPPIAEQGKRDRVMESETHQNGWVRAAVGALCALLLGLGLGRFGFPPFVPVLIQQGWFTPPEAHALVAASLGGYLFGALLMTWVSGRLPLRWTISGSVATSVAAMALSIGARSFLSYFALRLLAGISGAFLNILVLPAVMAATPASRRALSSAIAFCGPGAGILLSGTVLPTLLVRGVRLTWIVLAVSGVILALLTSQLLRRLTPVSRRGRRPQASRPITGVFVLGLVCAGNALAFVPHTVFWTDLIARDLGRGIRFAGWNWAVMGLGAILLPPLMGRLADAFGTRRLLQLSLVLEAGAVGMPLLARSPVALLLSSFLLAGLSLAVTSLVSARLGELRPEGPNERAWGAMTLVFAAAYALGAFGETAWVKRTGASLPPFAFGAVAALVSAVSVWLQPQPAIGTPLAPDADGQPEER